eukprot:CAMPEP_0118924102 /NCGR_PEP_ID=MMETSP1169-20130426/2389_1 /TAXON_ID=36882 /ORGANISM="Pyramimonas obovata, Strain CCMP722" /LENGTH=302 /DNA_ID=CAMNT_0006865185 /DNA_START=105 /DNA_END=1010 /DNA_ORIENTATION=-
MTERAQSTPGRSSRALPWAVPVLCAVLQLCLVGAQSSDNVAVSDVCIDNTFPPCPDFAEVEVPAGVELGHTPTCFNPDITDSTLVDATELHAVRCYSPSTTLAATPPPCGEFKTFEEAVAVCTSYRGKEGTSSDGVSDWRIPASPAEAGQACGSGCGYDLELVWVGFAGTSSPTSSPTTVTPTAVGETFSPTDAPTLFPTFAPTLAPTLAPTVSPTFSPTAAPTVSPTTIAPTFSPTVAPTDSPTTFAPTDAPTSPTAAPTVSPTDSPTGPATVSPTLSPPTSAPTVAPTDAPTFTAPTESP